jgi:hypothetical protein
LIPNGAALDCPRALARTDDGKEAVTYLAAVFTASGVHRVYT